MGGSIPWQHFFDAFDAQKRLDAARVMGDIKRGAGRS